MIAKKCPECGAEMKGHSFNGRLYYVCQKCGKEMIIPFLSL
ncbi:MAG: zf-TFIIB domain-containing protein [Candidatus Thermoplasmatota archaeon]